MREQQRRLDRLARRHRRGARAVRGRRACRWCRSPCRSRSCAEFYEGFSNATLWPLYHDLVAKPEFHREWWDAYVTRQPALRRRRREVRRRERDRLGAGLPAPARARRCCASCGPTCGSASSCTSRSRRPSCSPSCRGAARSSRGCSAPTSSASSCPGAAAELRPAGAGAGRPQDPPRLGLPARRPRGAGPAFPISIDAAGFEELARSEPVAARAEEIRDDLGNPKKLFLGVDRLDYTKGIYARLRAFSELIADGRLQRRGRGLRPGGDARRANGSTSTASSATTSTAWSAASTATSAASADRRSPTCTRRSRARRWPRSTAPPTSWSSRRSATA